MVTSEHSDISLSIQGPSSVKERDIQIAGAMRRLRVFTCTVTAANYALWATGRIESGRIANKIEKDTQSLIERGSVYHRGGKIGEFGGFSTAELLVQDEKVPVFCPLFDKDKTTWYDYTRQWLEEGGVVVVSGTGHARAWFYDRLAKSILELDPLTGKARPVDFTPQNYEAFVGKSMLLIPPQPKDCSPAMQALLEEQLAYWQGRRIEGKNLQAQLNPAAAFYAPQSRQLIERDYLPLFREREKLDLVITPGDIPKREVLEISPEQVTVRRQPEIIHVQVPPRTTIEVRLPHLGAGDIDRDSVDDIQIIDPEKGNQQITIFASTTVDPAAIQFLDEPVIAIEPPPKTDPLRVSVPKKK